MWIFSAESCGDWSQLPLVGLGIGCVRVHCDLREELVDQTQQPWIIGTEGCLQKRGGYTLSGGARGTRSWGYITFRRVFRALFERTGEGGPKRRRRVIFQQLFRFVTVISEKPNTPTGSPS